MPSAEKVALIIGAGSGIGRATAQAFLKAGYSTVLTGRRMEALEESVLLDGRKYGIAVGQIDIGNALTDMARAMTKGVPQADGSIQIEDTMDVSVWPVPCCTWRSCRWRRIFSP